MSIRTISGFGAAVSAVLLTSGQANSQPIELTAETDAHQILVPQFPKHGEEFGFDLEHGSFLDLAGKTPEVVVIGSPGFDNDGGLEFIDERGRITTWWYDKTTGLFEELSAYEMRGNDELLPDFAWFGQNITHADLTGNGTDELIISAPGKNPDYGDVGRVFIYQETDPPSGWELKGVITGEQAGDNFGWSIDTPDLNYDGKPDLLIGAPSWSQSGQDLVGRIYVIYGGWNGGALGNLQASTDSDLIITGHVNPKDGSQYREVVNRFGFDVQGLGLMARGATFDDFIAASAFRGTYLDCPMCQEFPSPIYCDCRQGVVIAFSMDVALAQFAQNNYQPIDAMDCWDVVLQGEFNGDGIGQYDKFGRNIAAGDFAGDADGEQNDLIIGAIESEGDVPPDGHFDYGYVRVSDISSGSESVLLEISGNDVQLGDTYPGDRFGWWVDDFGKYSGGDDVYEVAVSAAYWPDHGTDDKNYGRVMIFDGVSKQLLIDVKGSVNQNQIGWAFWSHHDFTDDPKSRNDLLITAPNAKLPDPDVERPGAVYFFRMTGISTFP